MRTNILLLLLSACVTAFAACSPRTPAPISSPDGSLTLHTSVEQSRADPTLYGCVIFEVRDATRENTHASNFQRWSMSWLSNDQIQLQSSDIGLETWARQ